MTLKRALKILVVPDKFKGTLTAGEAAEAIQRGWRSRRPNDLLELIPMSDGGDGFGEILSHQLGATPHTSRTVDAAHRPCDAVWWHRESSATAIVESAKVNGLALLPSRRYHPFELDTEGLGRVLKEAATRGAKRFLVGIGGSATNDAGFGMARALGWQFFNGHGEKLDRWTQLHNLAAVTPPETSGLLEEVIVAVDVQNPLLGPQGCTRIYGPQKGLRPEDFEFSERCLARLAHILECELHLKHAEDPGSGAAGGLGFGFRSFLGARLEGGFALFAEQVKLKQRLQGVDLVLTGEGAIDASTLMGKGVGELAALCQEKRVACVGFGGVVSDPEQARRLFAETYSLTPELATPEEAMSRPAHYLEQLSERAAATWKER